jgi:EAL domain-containing protein (putative c-di-GMP-specific phosphodiesterase class I)
VPEQIASLRDLGCELGQGFLFARPMNDEALFAYLVSGADTAAGRGDAQSNAA